MKKTYNVPESFKSDDEKKAVFFAMGKGLGFSDAILEEKWANRGNIKRRIEGHDGFTSDLLARPDESR